MNAFPTVRMEKGPTILLGSGNYHDYDAPERSLITIEDFAYALAFESRFRGQCVEQSTGLRVFYSIAQHCVIGSYEGRDAEECFAILMHEAGEPVCGDMVSPLKRKLPAFKTVEKAQEAAISARFGVVTTDPHYVKNVDYRLWATERRDLLPWNGESWTLADDIEPYAARIVPVGPYDAARMFIARWIELGGAEKFEAATGEVVRLTAAPKGPEYAAGYSNGFNHAAALSSSLDELDAHK